MDNIVPRFEPEVIHARSRHRYDGEEKVATTALKCHAAFGVGLSSRYGKADEYKTMVAMVEGVAPGLRCYIDHISCDSKAMACYTVLMSHCTRLIAKVVAAQLDEACLRCSGGHNGITLQGDNGGEISIDPNWGDFDD